MAVIPSTPENPFDNMLFWAVGLGIVWYFFSSFFSWATGIDSFNIYFINLTGGADGWYAHFLILVSNLVTIYIQVATIISALLILGTVYSFMRWRQIKKMVKVQEAKEKEKIQIQVVESKESNGKWLKILDHVGSENPAEWRLAILEADVLLEQVLDSASFRGETLGEKLKNADSGSLISLQSAWDAHKVRNSIAHEGSEFLLTKREAERVISMYEQVFKELNFI